MVASLPLFSFSISFPRGRSTNNLIIKKIFQAARETGRTRNISITWRSISESSNQSSTGFEIGEGRAEPPASRNTSHDSSPLDNHTHTAEDRTNHNVVTDINHHTRENGVTNGTLNGIDDVATKFLEVDLNGKLIFP